MINRFINMLYVLVLVYYILYLEKIITSDYQPSYCLQQLLSVADPRFIFMCFSLFYQCHQVFHVRTYQYIILITHQRGDFHLMIVHMLTVFMQARTYHQRLSYLHARNDGVDPTMRHNHLRLFHVAVKILVRNQPECRKIGLDRVKSRLHDNLFRLISALFYQLIKCRDDTPERKLLCSQWDKQFNLAHSLFQYVKERNYLLLKTRDRNY